MVGSSGSQDLPEDPAIPFEYISGGIAERSTESFISHDTLSWPSAVFLLRWKQLRICLKKIAAVKNIAAPA
jgi:hypothetical protein